MFIAHLPAGFLLTRWLQNKFQTPRFLWVGLLASVLPDIDTLYFYLIDHRQTPHHEYWTHLPVFWLSIWVVIMIGNLFLRKRIVSLISLLFFSNIFLHLVLDTFVGGISWVYPWSTYSFSLVTVPATHAFWVLSFIAHWSFLVELAIIVWAIWVLMKSKKQIED